MKNFANSDFSNYHLSAMDIYALLVVIRKEKFTPKHLIKNYENLYNYRLIYENFGDERNRLGENLPDGSYSINTVLAREYLISVRQNFYRSVLCPAIVAFVTAYLTAHFSL